MFKCMPIITSKRIVVRANSQTDMTKEYSTALYLLYKNPRNLFVSPSCGDFCIESLLAG